MQEYADEATQKHYACSIASKFSAETSSGTKKNIWLGFSRAKLIRTKPWSRGHSENT